jgi:hypothetical protein
MAAISSAGATSGSALGLSVKPGPPPGQLALWATITRSPMGGDGPAGSASGHGLRRLGVGRGDRVGWLGPNHPAFLESLFASGWWA